MLYFAIFAPPMTDNDLHAHFESMQAYRLTHIKEDKKLLRKKIRRLYKNFGKRFYDIANLSNVYLKYTWSEYMLSTLLPLVRHYRNVVRQAEQPRLMKPTRTYMHGFSPTNKHYTLHAAQGIVCVIVRSDNPIFYIFSQILSALLHHNSVVIFIDGGTIVAHTTLLKDLLKKVFDEREVCLLDSSDCSVQDIRALPFSRCYEINESIFESDIKPHFHFCIIDEQTTIARSVEEVFTASIFNAGQSRFATQAVFIHKKKYDLCVDIFLQLLRKKYPYHNTNVLHSSERYTRAIQKTEALQQSDEYVFLNHWQHEEKNNVCFFNPLIVEKKSTRADALFPCFWGAPVLTLVPYENETEIIELLRPMHYNYGLSIFSTHQKMVQYLLQKTCARNYFLNGIFSLIAPITCNMDHDFSHAFSYEKNIIICKRKGMREKMFLPPFSGVKNKYTTFTAHTYIMG